MLRPTIKQCREFCEYMNGKGDGNDWRIVHERGCYYTVYFCLSISGDAFQLAHTNTLNKCKKLCAAIMRVEGWEWKP